jgi:hypothetical protein
MGQAKSRGDYAERVAMAKQRNIQLLADIAELPARAPMHRVIREFGAQRTATRLTAVGVLAIPNLLRAK